MLALPLWLLTLHPSALSFGIVIGARSFLPIFLSIHGGVLMDRLGVRRVMLFFALVGLALPVLYPMLPFVAVAVVLQLILGLTTTMSWVGAQTVAGQTTKGNPRFIGRLSFSNRFGAFAGPLLAGMATIMYEGTPVRPSGVADAVAGLDDGVERRVGANAEARAAEVVVDTGRHADDAQRLARVVELAAEVMRAGERAILRALQPASADGRRADPHLPLQHPGA